MGTNIGSGCTVSSGTGCFGRSFIPRFEYILISSPAEKRRIAEDEVLSL